MRKGYGPTVVRFGYPFKAFKVDIVGDKLKVELVIKGNCYYPQFDFDGMTESELMAFYDRADNVEIRNGKRVIQLFT